MELQRHEVLLHQKHDFFCLFPYKVGHQKTTSSSDQYCVLPIPCVFHTTSLKTRNQESNICLFFF